jgi:intracellular sulfur oxidation DsrE/DsrF family protein
MKTNAVKIVLHAPTPGGVERARRNLGNILQAMPDAVVRILVNGDAVSTVLNGPDSATDMLTLVCPTTLKRIGATAPAPLTVLDEPGILALAHLQLDGWQYIRA